MIHRAGKPFCRSLKKQRMNGFILSEGFDRNTSGVLLLTNDGDLTQKLSHPSYEVRKIYEAKLDKPLTKSDFEKNKKDWYLKTGQYMLTVSLMPMPVINPS